MTTISPQTTNIFLIPKLRSNVTASGIIVDEQEGYEPNTYIVDMVWPEADALLVGKEVIVHFESWFDCEINNVSYKVIDAGMILAIITP